MIKCGLKSLAVFAIFAGTVLWGGWQEKKAEAEEKSTSWTKFFYLEECKFTSTGRNRYFILEPGYQLTLEGVEGKDTVRLVVTVLDETEKVGDIETRIVEEKEIVNGRTVEISKNFYAVCTQTNSVFYFGEDVDIYKDGKVISHDGSWRADSERTKAGLMMPGIILLEARYHQEIAPKGGNGQSGNQK